MENRQLEAALPAVTAQVTLHYSGDVSWVLDGWTVGEIEALLEPDSDEYQCARDAIVAEADRLEVDDADVHLFRGQLRAYLEQRKAKGLTGRVS